jgi:hypothetical protein
MLYAILCYDTEDIVGSWTREEDAAVMARLAVVNDKLARQGKLGPVARLMLTTAATTLRRANRGRRTEASTEPAVVLDGPYAETKEQLLGFFVVECSGLEEALEVSRELGEAHPGGAYEIRPIDFFLPGTWVA